ncbi:MAG: hypothetical protein ACFCGT_08165 [Sandaracinaceae bacterium]
MRRIVRLPTALCLLALVGCKVTPENIDYWTGTVKGPGKIVAVLTHDKYEDELRVHAGLALVRMDPRQEINGVTELEEALNRLDEGTQARIVDGMAPELIRMMSGADVPQGEDERRVSPLQERAKDAAFLVIDSASEGEVQRELLEAIINWYAQDFDARNLEGMFSAEVVVRQFGAPAAGQLVNALNAHLNQLSLVKIAELVADLGTAEAKAEAARRLVEIEREMEGAAFAQWLRGRLEAQYPDAEPERVNRGVEINRESHLTDGLLPAMKSLNDQRLVQDRLLELARRPETEEPILSRRVAALQAMEGSVRPEQVDALLTLALDDDTPPRVSDYAFDRVADSRDARIVTRLWPTFGDTDDWRMRWRVGSLILTLGGSDVVQPFFERMDDETYAHEELYGYAERLAQMRPPPTALMNARLGSDKWHDRVVALYFWSRQAERADIPRLEALTGDDARTAGPEGPNGSWAAQELPSVGKVAEQVVAQVRQRLEREAAEASEGGAADAGGDGESSEAASG